MGYGFFIRGTVQNPVFMAVCLSVSCPRDLRRRVCTLTRSPLAADPGGVSLVFNIAIGAHLLVKIHPVYGPAHPAPWRCPLAFRFCFMALLYHAVPACQYGELYKVKINILYTKNKTTPRRRFSFFYMFLI